MAQALFQSIEPIQRLGVSGLAVPKPPKVGKIIAQTLNPKPKTLNKTYKRPLFHILLGSRKGLGFGSSSV